MCLGLRGSGLGKQLCLCHVVTSLYGGGGPSVNLGSRNPILIHDEIAVSIFETQKLFLFFCYSFSPLKKWMLQSPVLMG